MKKLALIAALVSSVAVAQADDHHWNNHDRHGDYDRHVDESRHDSRFHRMVPLAAMDISRKETVDFDPHRDQFRVLRLRALRGAAYVDFVEVRFGNSEQQHIDVRRRIGAGEVVDLDLNGVRGLAAITVHGQPDRWSRIQIIGLR